MEMGGDPLVKAWTDFTKKLPKWLEAPLNIMFTAGYLLYFVLVMMTCGVTERLNQALAKRKARREAGT